MDTFRKWRVLRAVVHALEEIYSNSGKLPGRNTSVYGLAKQYNKSIKESEFAEVVNTPLSSLLDLPWFPQEESSANLSH